MGEIVNLNRVRKNRTKSEAKATAATNRVVHGQTKVEWDVAKVEKERAKRLIDGHRIGDQGRDG